jgi:hypothetical protein
MWSSSRNRHEDRGDTVLKFVFGYTTDIPLASFSSTVDISVTATGGLSSSVYRVPTFSE